MEHQLKIWPEHYRAVVEQRKTFEVRRDDRGFAIGDTLYLREFDPRGRRYTQRAVIRRVVHITEGGQHGIEPGYVVLGIA